MTDATPRMIPVTGCEAVAATDIEELSGAVKEHRTIKFVLDWCLSQTPPLQISDMVTQDEYTHDFIVPYRGDIHLVYDTT